MVLAIGKKTVKDLHFAAAETRHQNASIVLHPFLVTLISSNEALAQNVSSEIQDTVTSVTNAQYVTFSLVESSEKTLINYF